MRRIIRLWDLRASRGIVDHRDGAGHLPPTYEAELRARVHDRVCPAGDRAFVRGPSSGNPSAEQSGEDFVQAATSGEEAGADDLDDVSREDPFSTT